MLKPAEILEAALRKWPGVLRAEANGENLFPLRIPIGRPRPTADFALLRTEIELLAAASYKWRVDWDEIETRKWGRQRWPIKLEFESIEHLAETLSRTNELESFRAALQEARQRCPSLEPWLRCKAHRIVEHLADWNGLIAVCAHFETQPRPYCYPRQISLRLGTKFIEEHSAILREMLDVVVGEHADTSAATFAGRFHLLLEPAAVRFRFLDPALQVRNGWPVVDCSVPAPSFASLHWKIPRVLVVENRDVFLCLPEIAETLAVFGSGKASSLLHGCRWLEASQVVYWGDCDEAGYGILSNLRLSFPRVQSVLMDEDAWTKWKHLAVPGKRDSSVKHIGLTASERAALDGVLAGPWMLEQERIPVAEAEAAVMAAFGSNIQAP
jgi:hypothetical protein